MLRYGINKITYDYIQLTIIYENAEFFDMIQKSLDVYENIYDERTYENLDDNPALKVFILIDAEGIVSKEFNNKYKLLKGEEPIIEIKSMEDEDEIICIFSIPYIDTTKKIKLIKLSDVDYKHTLLDDNEIQKIINYILIINNKYTTEEVNEVTSYCDVFVKFLGEDILISSYKPSSNYLDFEQESILSGKKIGDYVTLENSASKLFSGEYNISKIIKYHSLEFTDEIAREINYNNKKTIADFKKDLKKDYQKILDFNNLINSIHENLSRENDISVSKYAYSFYIESNKKSANNKSKEQIYDIIKNRYIINYLYELYESENINPYLMEKYFKAEYGILKLLGTIKEMSYDDFFNARIEDAYLYMLIKKIGGK